MPINIWLRDMPTLELLAVLQHITATGVTKDLLVFARIC